MQSNFGLNTIQYVSQLFDSFGLRAKSLARVYRV